MPKKVTIYDIARALGISTATVNRALNDKPEVSPATRERVLKAAREMGFTINRAAKSLARAPIRMDFFLCNAVPAFHDEITRGVRQGFDELRDFNVTGEIHAFSGDGYEAQQEYAEALRALAGTKCAGALLLLPSRAGAFYEAIRALAGGGTKVALVNSDLPGGAHLFACRQNALLAGRMAAELLYWLAPSRNVAIFTGYKDASDHANSVGGFQKECAYRGMRIVSLCENHDDPGFAAYNTQELLRRHPEIEGIYINTANSISVCQKLRDMGLAYKVKVVASDIFPELAAMMRGDVVQAAIFQDPFRQGRQAVQQLYRCIAEGEIAPSEIFIRPQIVLQSNLAEFMQAD